MRCTQLISLKCLILAGIIIQYSCNNTKTSNATVVIYPKIGIGEKIYLSQVPFEGTSIVLDSVTVINNTDPVSFSYPNKQEELYELTSSFNNFKVGFVSDTNQIIIHADYFKRTSVIENSKGTASLLKYKQSQLILAKNKDSLFLINAVNYADTVKSPAVFVQAYKDVDFGKNYKGLDRFITRMVKRFPAYPAVKLIATRAHSFISIMTEEFQIGNMLPAISLPDQNGIAFNTQNLRGKLYLIDFWSTWCPTCTAFTQQKKIAYQTFSNSGFSIVSVALEPDAGDWKSYISKEKLAWPQLIDQKMWEGEAVNTLKFDSIPANFLVSGSGKILAKSIPADSLVTVIKKFLKP